MHEIINFQAVHLSINARSDDEVEPDEIMKQVRKCTTAGPRVASTLDSDAQAPVVSLCFVAGLLSWST